MAERKRGTVVSAQDGAGVGDLETFSQGLDGHGPLGELGRVNVAALRNDLPFAGGEASEDELLAAISAQVTGSDQDEGFVSIWKLNEQTRQIEYCGKSGASDFLADGPQDFLARNFGAGTYELKIYTSDKKLFKRPRVTVSKDAVEFIRRKNPMPEPSKNSGDIMAVVQVMQAGFERLGELIVQARPQQESRAQVLQELMQMKQIFGGGSAADPIDMFSKVAGLLKQMQPRVPGENENPLFELAERFLPQIMEVVSTQKVASPETIQQTAPVLHNPANTVAGVQVPQPQKPAQPKLSPEQIGAQKMSFQLKLQLGYLCSQAARDADPGPYAAIIADQVPREVLDRLLASENWLDELAAVHASVKQFPEWFEELRQAVDEELHGDGEPAGGENLQSGNSGDIQPENQPGANDVLERKP